MNKKHFNVWGNISIAVKFRPKWFAPLNDRIMTETEKVLENFKKFHKLLHKIFKIEILAKGIASFLFQPIDSFQSF